MLTSPTALCKFTSLRHSLVAGWSSLVARRAHNPKVVGSNPAPATILKRKKARSRRAFFVSNLDALARAELAEAAAAASSVHKRRRMRPPAGGASALLGTLYSAGREATDSHEVSRPNPDRATIFNKSGSSVLCSRASRPRSMSVEFARKSRNSSSMARLDVNGFLARKTTNNICPFCAQNNWALRGERGQMIPKDGTYNIPGEVDRYIVLSCQVCGFSRMMSIAVIMADPLSVLPDLPIPPPSEGAEPKDAT